MANLSFLIARRKLVGRSAVRIKARLVGHSSRVGENFDSAFIQASCTSCRVRNRKIAIDEKREGRMKRRELTKLNKASETP